MILAPLVAVAVHAFPQHASRSADRRPLTLTEQVNAGPQPSALDVLRLVWCESIRDGSWTPWADSRARGLFQFEPETWTRVGGTGDPADASVTEQYDRAVLLWRQDGESFREWECARIEGLR